MPTHQTTMFRGVVEEQLEERFQRLISGKEVDMVTPKILFYQHLDKFFSIYKDIKTPDIGRKNDPNSQYQYYIAEIIPSWCEKKINEIKTRMQEENKTLKQLGYKTIDNDSLQHWVILRRQLRIIPTQRAFVSWFGGEGYLDDKNSDIRFSGLLLIIGERATLLSKIGEELNSLDYPATIISTTGTAASMVSEIVELLSSIERDRKAGMKIAIFYLHNSDISGYNNYLSLLDSTQVYSLGINTDFIEYNKLDIEKLKETYVMPQRRSSETLERYEHKLNNRKNKLKNQILDLKNSKIKDIIADLGYYRIDQERVYALYGLEPFINYFEKIIKEEKIVWDITKICKLELTKPKRYFELQTRILNIWELLENKYMKDWNWESCSETLLEQYTDKNSIYDGDITEIVELINQQKAELQKIIDTNPINNEILDKIEEEIKKIEDKLS